MCEKALAEYLETKRLAFPRFYFVSSADLLDILSNGNNPSEVILERLFLLVLNCSDLIFQKYFCSRFHSLFDIACCSIGQQALVKAV